MNTSIGRCQLATWLLWSLLPGAAAAGVSEDIFRSGFEEGESSPGAQISGRVFSDLNADGNLSDGAPLAGVKVYLDQNYNGAFDDGEPNQLSGAQGEYLFAGLTLGLKHVRQTLPAPNVQTVPEPGISPAVDFLPDEVTEYVHAAPGVGDFDVPYGKNAGAFPPNWGDPTGGPLPQPVSVDLVLKPLGVRTRRFGVNVTQGAEALSLPQGASLTVRFDEAIIDGPGDDLILYTIGTGSTDEVARISVGATAGEMVDIGEFTFVGSLDRLPLDLGSVGFSGPVRFVRLLALDNGGTWKGFEITSFEAINVATPDPGAHRVEVTDLEAIYANRDFGRHFQDLAPTLTLGLTDLDLGTPGLRAGEAVEITVNAFDDLGLASVALLVNGQPLALDSNQTAQMTPANAGELSLQATAEDSAGQQSTREATYYVLNADGSDPLNPNVVGQSAGGGPNAPRARILSPAPGESFSSDVPISAAISRMPPGSSWVLEYAPVDLIDPFQLHLADTDYIELSTGTGNVYSTEIASMPLSALADGIYFLRLSARNPANQVAYFGQVIARNVDPVALRPRVLIDAPVASVDTSLPAQILGRIISTRAVREWFVEYARADLVDLNNLGSNAPPWRRIAEGTGAINDTALLGVFDATLVRSDSYVIRIVARNDIGLGWVEPLLINVVGEAKFGRNRLEFADIEVELEGFPLRFVRVYDTLQSEISGDLGFGWSLQLQDTDLRETVADTGVAGLFGSTPFRVGTRVYLTAPGGERLGFTFDPQPGQPSTLGIPYRATFDADPGNYHRLEVPQGQQAFLTLRADGSVYLFGFAFPYNPATYVLVAPDGKRYTVHEDAGLLRAEDPAGRSITFNPNGVQHSSGPRLTFFRDAQGRITSVSDPEGNAWIYAYDAQGDLVSLTDPDGNTSTYAYRSNPAHFLESVTDPQGRMPRRFEYDPDTGRLFATIDERGNRVESIADPLGFTGMTVDGRGNATVLEYDQRGNITRLTDPRGESIAYQYTDPANPDRETRLTDAEGGVWNTIYDAMGRPTRVTTPLASGLNQRYDIAYDALGNVTRFEDADNLVDDFEYDPVGNRVSESPADGITATYRYGPAGQRLERTIAQNYSVLYQYNDNGQPASVTDSIGYQQELDYSRRGLLRTNRDSRGELNIAYTRGAKLSTQIDDDGQQAGLVENPDGSLTRTDRLQNVTDVALDADERPQLIMQPDGAAISTTYDASGNPASLTDPLGNVTTFTFDRTNLLERVTDALGQAQTYLRDGNGNVTEITDRNGKRRTFTWDANQRMTAERWHEGASLVRETRFIYVGSRGLAQVDDEIGGVVHRIRYVGTLPRPLRVDYEMPGQSTWLLNYDWSSQYQAPVDIRVGIDENNLARLRTEPYATESARLRWAHPGSSGTDNQVQLLRNPDSSLGRVLRFTGANGGQASVESVFAYDNLGNLTQVRHQTATGLLLHPNAQLDYSWDAERRVLGESHVGNSVTVGYDANGQLVAAAHSAAAYVDETYSYDAAGNRVTSHLAPDPATILAGNRLAQSGNLSFSHDNAGNVIERRDLASGEVAEFGYDHRNRLVQVLRRPSAGAPADQTVAFEYDYLDRLLYREIDGVRTWIIHDREQPFVEFADGATTINASYFYDPDEVDVYYGVWRDDALGERWLFNDQQGSVRGISNASFAIQSWVDYDSFGQRQPGSSPAADEPVGYAGRFWNESIGLYDNRRRQYAPQLGRFTQEDPTLFGGRDHHLYRYARSSPYFFRDPSGEAEAANYAQFAEDLLLAAIEASDGVQALSFPCHIARWSASLFGYFEPLSEIIRDPRDAVKPPRPDPNELLEKTGCNTK